MKVQHNNLSSIILRAIFETTILRDECQKPTLSIQSGESLCEIAQFDVNRLRNCIIDRMGYSEFESINHLNTYINSVVPNSSQVNFYEIVRDFADNLITRMDGRYCFRYEFTDIWIDTVRDLGEELFVTAKVVLDDMRCSCSRPLLNWQYCIEHDNHEIKKMLSRDQGVSENHFHLRSSSPYFDISWIYLMNNVESSKYRKAIERIQNNPLNPNPTFISDYSLVTVWRKAAALRRILFNMIENTNRIQNDDCNSNYTANWSTKSPYKIAKIILTCDNLDMESMIVTELQNYIAFYSNKGNIDYAGTEPISDTHFDFISGERYILYNCLKKIFFQEEDFHSISVYLFLYLMMKNRFYREMVQSNKRNGFHNFNEYQFRKDYFIPWEVEKNVAAETIYSVLECTKMHSFEMRIYPAENADTIYEDLLMYIDAIKIATERLNAKYEKKIYPNGVPCFFTLHFIKDTPRECEKKQCTLCTLANQPRHFILRARLKKQTNAIMSLDTKLLFDWVKGIDAAGEEIKCRPEVFAIYFRKLLHYFRPRLHDTTEFQLRATYHVGEDNYDLLDGIRAIYEAVFFLDLRSGSRLGHATLLGNSVYRHYSPKRNPCSVPAQVFLDNLVWIYFFIKENSITFDKIEHLFEYIRHNFNIYFKKIYESAVRDTSLTLRHMEQIESDIDFSTNNFSIDDYYLSYLLRGDDPELYMNPKCFLFNEPIIVPISEEYRICNTHMRMKEARQSSRAKLLYHLYQYNCEVKKAGEESTSNMLPEYFIHAIDLVQQEMRRKLTYRGIAIETNPSSNQLISNFTHMEDHPISVFYDYMLLNDSSKVQMNVSINTDDKSIFSTSLPNEYAYLAFYLEHKKNADGKYSYNHLNIMQWLNNIRIMGNEQSFIDKQ